MRTLLVAALYAETFPIVELLRGARPLSRRLIEGRLAGEPVAVLTCGVGQRRARARTEEALERLEVDTVVSFGTCGALVELELGTVVSGHDWPGAVPARVVTVSRGIFDPAVRAELAAHGHEVCEMEAAGVEEASAGRTFRTLKVVSDLAGAGKGEEDFAPGGPLAIARFQKRALQLVRTRLRPVLIGGLPALRPG